MGLRDAFLSELIRLLFRLAMITNDPASPNDTEKELVWDRAQVLIIDGSLFYRRFRWEALGSTWQGYLDAVWMALSEMMDRCPRLQSLVFIIDKYGPGTREPLPKRIIQAHRYAGAVKIPDVAGKFEPDKPVAGLDSTNVFGNLDARMAFNEMVTTFLRRKLAAYSVTHPVLDHIIIDGAVVSGRARVLTVPVDKGTPSEPMPNKPWMSHSEGDIGIAHWLAKYGHRVTLIESADVDIQQVVLRVVQRWSDSGLRPDEIADVYLHKLARPVEQMFDMKLYYQIVRSLFSEKNANTTLCHPVDVWTMLTASCGNDFCSPWLCSPECARGERDGSDGIRLEAIWYAYVTDFAAIGPLFEPTTEADVWAQGAPWSVLQRRTYVYPIRPRVEAWQTLMKQALHYQQIYWPRRKVAASPLLLNRDQYVVGQLRRMTWSVFYYANAALLDEDMPTGVEVDEETGESLHGWVRVLDMDPPKDVDIARRIARDHEQTLHALWGASAPSMPPTPTPSADTDPVDVFNRLEAQIDRQGIEQMIWD